MTPEIRRKLENNTTTFGLMEPELQEALQEAINAGARYRRYAGNTWYDRDTRVLSRNHTYRLAPSALVIPDALWDLLDKKWVVIVKSPDWIACCDRVPVKGIDGFYGAQFEIIDDLFPNLDPYNCDWRNSLVMRPGYEGSE